MPRNIHNQWNDNYSQSIFDGQPLTSGILSNINPLIVASSPQPVRFVCSVCQFVGVCLIVGQKPFCLPHHKTWPAREAICAQVKGNSKMMGHFCEGEAKGCSISMLDRHIDGNVRPVEECVARSFRDDLWFNDCPLEQLTLNAKRLGFGRVYDTR